MYSYSTFSYGFLLQVNSLLFWNSNFLSASPESLILLQLVRFHSLEINELGYIVALPLALELHKSAAYICHSSSSTSQSCCEGI